jgi:hypothetical protein
VDRIDAREKHEEGREEELDALRPLPYRYNDYPKHDACYDVLAPTQAVPSPITIDRFDVDGR